MSSICQYRLYCNTQSDYKYVWSTSIPSTCPDNNTHTINIDSITIVNEISENTTTIKEEETPTGGHFIQECWAFDCPANTETSYDIAYPYPVSSSGLFFETALNHKGDVLNCIMAPDAIIGTITSNVAIGDTIIHVSSTVLTYISVGFSVKLFNGTQHSCETVVINKNLVNSTLTLQTPINLEFIASSPTFVKMYRYIVKNFEIGEPSRHIIGSTKIGASYIPANTIARVKYQNNGSESKRFIIRSEMLY